MHHQHIMIIKVLTKETDWHNCIGKGSQFIEFMIMMNNKKFAINNNKQDCVTLVKKLIEALHGDC